ncbi:uncharacterized protein LOC124495011 isoform X2 [Dermatophagoides farinae]|uniref:uncharacterized protein LOC124495011 isoform X2 n=1 Tax=Dermatophagoides farinae TaxID=6954 RepID=UPI003F625448
MTVSYQYDVASSSTGGFFRLLWRWRGSIWKLLYKELLLFVAVYMCIAFTYDFLMTDYYKKYYEHIVIFCSAFVEVIPLSFILGFYVSFTATRWWQQYTAIPWPDKLMNIIALYIPGNDVTSRVLRRTLMRYLNLTLVLVLRSISIPVKRRFPTKEHLVEAGFMSRPELEIYQSVPSHEFNTFWIPCTWFVNLLREAKSECRITDSGGIKLIMEEFNEFRSKCGLLWSYDWVSIPLVYTQVVTLSTQAFFLASLLGRQHINPAKQHVYGEYYIPIFTMLQFILYMGLLKLGEQLINPFGDDDEDFELNWIIDRHLKVSFLGVDVLNSDPPPLIKDNYFDEMDIKLPYTEAAVAHKVKTYRGSVAAFHVPTEKHGLVIPEFEDENGADSDDEPSTIQSNRDAVARNNSWSLFSSQRKRKLSSSFDSFNSELMVETGLSESEMPELVPTNSSWPTFLQTEQQQQLRQQAVIGDNKQPATSSVASLSSKLSVWPMNRQEQRKANEDTQGIRSDNGPKNEASTINNDDNKNQQPTSEQQQSIDDRQPILYKQSSFSTSDSSIAITMGETTYQWPNQTAAARIFRPHKSPLQVYSKEMANAPISVFNQILESNLRRQSKNSSLSSLGSTKTAEQTVRTFKPYKSLIKPSRQADPKLRIRPFRSKVTFSDDTKNDDNTLQIRSIGGRGFQYQYDSSSESNSSLMRVQEIGQQQSSSSQHSKTRTRTNPRLPLPPPSVDSNRNFSLKSIQDLPFNENRKRRQSMDPTIYQRDKPIVIEETGQDNWLHYQSLPNIQEEDQQVALLSLHDVSPTIPTASDSLAMGQSIQRTPLDIRCHHQPSATLPEKPKPFSPPEEILQPSELPISQPQPEPVNPPLLTTTQITSPDVLLSPSLIPETTSTTTMTTSNPVRKKSFKRQKSQEIPDEDLKLRLSSPKTANKIMVKQSSSDSQGSSNSSSNKGIMPPGILKKRNETTLKQASTESDTGSYHTVRSLVMHPSSSIDSFTSAVSDPITSNGNSSSNGENDNTTVTIINTDKESTLTENRLLSFPTIESTLVPKIIFSQSTPSVTSQSSDDQNSPKWDERYSEFSSMETIVHSMTEDSNTTLRLQKNNPQTNNLKALKDEITAPSTKFIHKSMHDSSIIDSAASSSSSSTHSPTSSCPSKQQQPLINIRKGSIKR